MSIQKNTKMRAQKKDIDVVTIEVTKKKNSKRTPKKKQSRTPAKKVPVVPAQSDTTAVLAPSQKVRETNTSHSHKTLATPLIQEIQHHPERALLLFGEYYLIAVLCALIGIASMCAILALW